MIDSIGFLHPGAMGSAMASCCLVADRLWVCANRSEESSARAAAAGLTAVETLAVLCEQVDAIVSICPPAAAVDVADAVAAQGFDGIFVDANAISPDRARDIGRRFVRFVDGGVVGPPPLAAGSTRLYLSGSSLDAQLIADAWRGSGLDARVMSGGSGAASALKMAYASWTKGSSGLLLAVAALAEAEGVSDELAAEWDLSQPGLVARAEHAAAGVGPKAWRFEGEMHEIAHTFASADLPDGFHLAAAEVYARLASLKGTKTPSLDETLALLRSVSDS